MKPSAQQNSSWLVVDNIICDGRAGRLSRGCAGIALPRNEPAQAIKPEYMSGEWENKRALEQSKHVLCSVS